MFRQTLIFCAFPSLRLFALHQEGAHYIDPDTPVKGFSQICHKKITSP
jgi:hypothetical protein